MTRSRHWPVAADDAVPSPAGGGYAPWPWFCISPPSMKYVEPVT